MAGVSAAAAEVVISRAFFKLAELFKRKRLFP
jgi:23S rRNA U2552 (ribose-2'-O)-methylase RlmE/FtsJ